MAISLAFEPTWTQQTQDPEQLDAKSAGKNKPQAAGRVTKQVLAGTGTKDQKELDQLITKGDPKALERFLTDKGKQFDINAQDQIGFTALHRVVFLDGKHSPEMAKVLIDKGRIDIAKVDENGLSAYELARDLVNNKDLPGRKTATLVELQGNLGDALTKELRSARDKKDTKRVAELIAAGAQTDGPVDTSDYQKDLKELAKSFAEKIDHKARTVKGLSSKTHAALYKRLVRHELVKEGGPKPDLEKIDNRVKDDFKDALEEQLKDDPDKSKKLDVFKGYWNGPSNPRENRERGFQVASDLANQAYHEYVKNPQMDDDDIAELGNDPLEVLMKEYDWSEASDDPVPLAEYIASRSVGEAVKGLKSDFNRKRLIAAPDEFTTEERARAATELELVISSIQLGKSKGWDTAEGNNGKGDHFDASDKVIAQIEGALAKIVNAPVAQLKMELQDAAMVTLANDPKIKERCTTLAKSMLDEPNINQFKDLWKQAAHYDKPSAMSAYVASFEMLNLIAGGGKEPLYKHAHVNVEKTGYKEEILKTMNDDFMNMNRLQDLIDGKGPGTTNGEPKMTPEQAVNFLAARIPVYGFYGGNTLAMEDQLKGMIHNYAVDNADWRSVWSANGDKSLSTAQYKELLEKFKKQYPDMAHKDMDSGAAAAVLQKIDATLKGAGYWDMSTILQDGAAKLNNQNLPPKKIGELRQLLREAFKGNLQMAGMVISSLWLGAEASKGSKSDKDIVKIAGLSMMTMDYALETFNRQMRTGRYTPKFPGIDVPWYQPLTGEGHKTPWLSKVFNGGKPIPRVTWDSFNTAGKLLGGAGLGMLGGLGVASGINMIQDGHKPQGILKIIEGALNTGAGVSLATDAALGASNIARYFSWSRVADKSSPGLGHAVRQGINARYIATMGRIAAVFAPIGVALNGGALGIMLAEIITNAILDGQGKNKWRKDLYDSLDPYDIKGKDAPPADNPRRN